MAKIAFKMKLHRGQEAEYKRRHDEIWPELAVLLKDNGISDYTIFLDEETNILFAVQNQEETSSQNIVESIVLRRWWDYMADIMEVNPDNSPVCTTLVKVFHMD